MNPYSVLPRKKGMREGGRLPATTSASGRQNFTCPFSPGVVSLPPHLVKTLDESDSYRIWSKTYGDFENDAHGPCFCAIE